ncbi:uncharacterized protein DMENIID0001_038950 [Sergentomyia squamirostris]
MGRDYFRTNALPKVKPLPEVVPQMNNNVPQPKVSVKKNATDDEKADPAYLDWLYDCLLRNTSTPKSMLGYEYEPLFSEPDNLYDDEDDDADPAFPDWIYDLLQDISIPKDMAGYQHFFSEPDRALQMDALTQVQITQIYNIHKFYFRLYTDNNEFQLLMDSLK